MQGTWQVFETHRQPSFAAHTQLELRDHVDGMDCCCSSYIIHSLRREGRCDVRRAIPDSRNSHLLARWLDLRQLVQHRAEENAVAPGNPIHANTVRAMTRRGEGI